MFPISIIYLTITSIRMYRPLTCLQLSPDWYGDVFDYLKDWEKEIDSHPEHPIYHCNYEVTKQVPFPSKGLRLSG